MADTFGNPFAYPLTGWHYSHMVEEPGSGVGMIDYEPNDYIAELELELERGRTGMLKQTHVPMKGKYHDAYL